MAASRSQQRYGRIYFQTPDLPPGISLRAFRELYPYHIEVFVTDAKGALVAATNRTSDYYQGDETWWQNTAGENGRVFVSSP